MAIGTTNYPATLDTPTELIRVANLASSTIGVGGVTNVATTIPVTDTTTFASDGVVWCGTEAISYTAKTATTLTGAVRGFDVTTAAAHAAGDPIYGDIITSAHHEALRGAIIALQTTLGATNGVLPPRTLTTPTVTDFSNAQHSHGTAAGAGALVFAALPGVVRVVNTGGAGAVASNASTTTYQTFLTTTAVLPAGTWTVAFNGGFTCYNSAAGDGTGVRVSAPFTGTERTVGHQTANNPYTVPLSEQATGIVSDGVAATTFTVQYRASIGGTTTAYMGAFQATCVRTA